LEIDRCGPTRCRGSSPTRTRVGQTTLDIYARAISEDGRKFSAAVEAVLSSVSNLLAENNPGQGIQEVLN
jgi:hypothetical protein